MAMSVTIDPLVEVSESVAEAAGEGLLGMGEKVSKREASALGKIEAALKCPATITITH